MRKNDKYDWNGLFARAWRRHRLTREQVLAMTPCEYDAYEKDWLEDIRRQDMFNSISISSVCNMLKGKKGRAFKPSDFQVFKKKKTAKDFKAILDFAVAMTKDRKKNG